MAKAKAKKVEGSAVSEAKTKKSVAKVNAANMQPQMEEITNDIPENTVCEEECCNGPLVRNFTTYDGFNYNFTYGGCKEFCGNTEDKFSVVLKTNVMPMHIGDYQCVCVKRPILTGRDGSDVVWFDFEVGTNGFPMGSFSEYIRKFSYENYISKEENMIDNLFALYLSQLQSFDMGYEFGCGDCPPLIHINEVIKNYYSGDPSDGNDFFIERMRNNEEARYIVSMRLANTPQVHDNVIITAIGMEFIRQFMSAVNTTLSLWKSSSIFVPDIRTIFLRNIRHEVSQGYYPEGFMEVIRFIKYVMDMKYGCGDCAQEDYPEAPDESK